MHTGSDDESDYTMTGHTSDTGSDDDYDVDDDVNAEDDSHASEDDVKTTSPVAQKVRTEQDMKDGEDAEQLRLQRVAQREEDDRRTM